MSEPLLSHELDEISDTKSFSILAIVGFLLSLVGIFSLSYIHTMPVALIGALLGAFTLVTAKHFDLNWFSRILGFLAVTIGVTVFSWGWFERQLNTSYDLEQAKRVSQLYLDSLSKDDLDTVYYLVGFQFQGSSPRDREEGETELDRAKKRLNIDPAHVEIRGRRNPSKWVFQSLEGESMGTVGYSYKLKYRDEGQTNPPSYWVYARKNAEKFEVKDEVRWFVDTVEAVKTK
jgi:hypothetical protein